MHRERLPSLCRRNGDGVLQIKFIDLDRGGKAGLVRYLPFMKDKVDWAVPEPVGKPIEQDHDIRTLKRGLAECCLGEAERPVKKKARKAQVDSLLSHGILEWDG